MEVSLKIDNKEFSINQHRLLKEMINRIDDDEQFTELFQELAKSQLRTIRASVSWYSSINEETVLLLLKDKSLEVLRSLPKNEKVQMYANAEQIEYLINTGDFEVMQELASYAGDFEKSICDLIANQLVISEDPEIRYTLALNSGIPINILYELTKDDDRDVANQAKKTIEVIIKKA